MVCLFVFYLQCFVFWMLVECVCLFRIFMNCFVFCILQLQWLFVVVFVVFCVVVLVVFVDIVVDFIMFDKVVVKGECVEGYLVCCILVGICFDLVLCEILQLVSIISYQCIEDQNLDDIIDVLVNIIGVISIQFDSECIEFYVCGFYIDVYQFDGLFMQMVQNWSYGDFGLDLVLYDCVEVVCGVIGLFSGVGNLFVLVNLICKYVDSVELVGSVLVNVGSWGCICIMVDVGSVFNVSGIVCGCVIGSYLDIDGQMDCYNQCKMLGYVVIDVDLILDMQLSVGYDYQQKCVNGVIWGGFLMLYLDGLCIGYDELFNVSLEWIYWDIISKWVFVIL